MCRPWFVLINDAARLTKSSADRISDCGNILAYERTGWKKPAGLLPVLCAFSVLFFREQKNYVPLS